MNNREIQVPVVEIRLNLRLNINFSNPLTKVRITQRWLTYTPFFKVESSHLIPPIIEMKTKENEYILNYQRLVKFSYTSKMAFFFPENFVPVCVYIYKIPKLLKLFKRTDYILKLSHNQMEPNAF